MKCPHCGRDHDKVIDSRPADAGLGIRRRRACLECGHRFTTYEKYEQKTLYVLKRDGQKEPFDRAKLKFNLLKSCHKRRRMRDAELDSLIERVEVKARSRMHDDLIESKMIGELVLEELAAIDPVSYIRFASVYRDFDSVDAFVAELDFLQKGKA